MPYIYTTTHTAIRNINKYILLILLLPFLAHSQKNIYEALKSTNIDALTDSEVTKTYLHPILNEIKLCTSDTCKIYYYRSLGLVYIDNANRLKSKEYLDSALKWIDIYILKGKEIKKYELLKASIYNELAIFNLSVDYGLSLYFNNKAFIIYEKYNDLVRMRSSISNYGSLYSSTNQYDKSIDYFLQDREVIKKLLQTDSSNRNYNLMLAQNYNNIGVVYLKSKKYAQAILAFNSGLKISKAHDDTLKTISTYGNLATTNRYIKDFETANRSVEMALNLLKYKKNNRLLTMMHLIKAKILNDVGDLTSSLRNIKLAEYLSKTNSYVENLREIYEFRAKLSLQMKKYEDAAHYYKLFNDLKDSIYKQEILKSEFEFKEKYEAKKKENLILKLTTTNNIKELEIINERESKRFFIIIIVSLTVILFLVLIVFITANRLRKNKVKASIESNKQAAQIAKYQSQMNPHFIFNALSNLQNLVLKNKPSEANNLLVNFTKLMRATLNNSELEYIKLSDEIEYIKMYCEFEKSKFDYTVDFKINIDQALDVNHILILPMLIQPFIENSFKHGGFSEIKTPKILLEIVKVNETVLEVCIIDNGKGLQQKHQSKEHQSKGLSITKKRVELWHEKYGREETNYFLIQDNIDADQKNAGTMVKLLLPLIDEF